MWTMSVPERDVDRAGDAGAVGGQHEARVGVRAADVVDVLAERAAEAELVLAPSWAATAKASAVSRAMPNWPPGSCAADVLARLAGEGQLEVVDGGRAVHGHAP